MAYITFQPNDYFNTKLYDGTGSTNNITGVGFQPDWVWIKKRSASGQHQLFDSVRGVTKRLYSDAGDAESTSATTLTTFGTDGFTVGSNSGINANGSNIVSWNWKAGTTSGITTNGTTTITPSAYSFNQTSGFSIVKYTGNGTAGAYLAHGLGAAPEIIFAKSTNLAGEPWQVYSKSLGNDKRLFLNLTNAETSATEWNSTTPDSVNIRLGDGTHINSSGNTFIAYCFTPIQGFSSMGAYKGNGSTNGAFIYTGFKPAFIIFKRTSGTDNWVMIDNKRLGYNELNYGLFPNTTAVEQTDSDNRFDLLSNGFKIRNSGGYTNTSGQDYLYMAFAEEPLVSSNGIPATAR
jgi:hypothetical protein